MRGAVTFDAGGEAYTLRFTTNALCRLEERAGKSIGEVIDEMSVSGRSSQSLRLLFWAALGDKTLEQAGDLIDEIGPTEADALIAAALKAAFPAKETSAEGNGEATAA